MIDQADRKLFDKAIQELKIAASIVPTFNDVKSRYLDKTPANWDSEEIEKQLTICAEALGNFGRAMNSDPDVITKADVEKLQRIFRYVRSVNETIPPVVHDIVVTSYLPDALKG